MITWLREQLSVFVLALQFLTRLPIRADDAYTPQRFTASVNYFPLVGVLIGAFAAIIYWLGYFVFPSVLAALISVGATVLFTGAFHEDGLADTFDGIGGGATREQALEIMRDSRIGTYGALVLVLVLATKVGALAVLPSPAVEVGLIVAHGLSRWSSVFVVATSQYVRDHGTGKAVAEGITRTGLVLTALVGAGCLVVLYLMLSAQAAVFAAIGLIVGHGLSRLLYERKLGGYTGDCLGATQQISEIGVYLGIVACL